MEFHEMKFIKTKYDQMDGQTVVAFTQDTEQENPFTVKCFKGGVTFSGKMDGEIFGENDLQLFAKFIADAWSEHRKLKPKIHTSLAD